MRTRAVLLTLATVVVTMTTLAAAATKDPKTLLLRKTDLPAGATYAAGTGPRNLVTTLGKLGIEARAAYFSATYGDEIEFSGLVVTIESASKARKVFPRLKGGLGGDAKTRLVRMPAYGDEQFATTSSGSADLLVRKKAVIWSLSLVPSLLAPMSRDEMAAELQKFAAKQKARVGAG